MTFTDILMSVWHSVIWIYNNIFVCILLTSFLLIVYVLGFKMSGNMIKYFNSGNRFNLQLDQIFSATLIFWSSSFRLCLVLIDQNYICLTAQFHCEIRNQCLCFSLYLYCCSFLVSIFIWKTCYVVVTNCVIIIAIIDNRSND
jgi:hypothetical protein